MAGNVIKPTLLLDVKGLDTLVGGCLAALNVVRLWDYPDPSVYAEGPGRSVTAILHAGALLPPWIIDASPALGLIARLGSGYDSVDIPYARSRGIAVSYTPGVHSADVADHAIALLLALRKGVVEGDRLIRAGDWWGRQRGPMRPSLHGAKIGIVGLGAIGLAAAKRMAAFDTEVRWWGPRPKPGAPYPQAANLVTLASWSDALIICARADPSNQAMIDDAVFEALGPGGVIVNVARGSMLDEDALIERLTAGTLGGAALDVFADEPTSAKRWLDVPNVVLTPHVAGRTSTAVAAMAALALDNVLAFLAGKPLITPVPDEPVNRQ